jgi:tetrahydromethanopterin S-methyltransferase subunit F
MTTREQKGLAAGVIMGLAIGLMIALVIAMKPGLFAALIL